MLTSEEIIRNEMLTKQETKEFISNHSSQPISEINEIEVYELRELLTFVKSNSQFIESSHPDVKEYVHWSEMITDINAMADRLSEYERRIHNMKEASFNIQ